MMIVRVFDEPINYVEPVILLIIGICAVITMIIRKKKSFFTVLLLCLIGNISGIESASAILKLKKIDYCLL